VLVYSQACFIKWRNFIHKCQSVREISSLVDQGPSQAGFTLDRKRGMCVYSVPVCRATLALANVVNSFAQKGINLTSKLSREEATPAGNADRIVK